MEYCELKATKTQQSRGGFTTTTTPRPLTARKNLDKGLYQRELLSAITFYIRKNCAHSRAYVCLPNIHSSQLPLSCPHSLGSPRLLPTSPELRMADKPQMPLDLMSFWGSCRYEINFSPVNLCYAKLIIRPTKKPRREEGNIVLPLR